MSNQVHFRTCNLCEAMCGLEIKVENNAIVSIHGDKNDTFSRGHICPKALALKDIYEDPNRLRHPMKRTPEGWVRIGWEEAFQEVASNIKSIQAKNGNNAVGIYQGNPSIHNLGTTFFSPIMGRAVKTKNNFSATSTDQLPHHVAAMTMFGHSFVLPVPDIDRTDYMLILGGNPIASNGSMMTVPDVAHRLKAIQERGGKVIVIDPRHTETAEKASEHHFIKPGTDAFFLLAMIYTIFKDKSVNLGKLSEFTDGIAQVRKVANDFSPQKVAPLVGIPAADIRRIARDFVAANSAVCYGRVGVSTQAFGGVCQWLINVINIITGNFDKAGGAMFTSPAFDILAQAKHDTRFNRWQSRVRGLPEFAGELPVAALAEEILTEGEGQIKAMITSCGNPILSAPNGVALDKAFSSLEFMVSVDIYLNETTRHANIILPPATGLEVSHYDVTFHHLAVRNTAKYAPPLFEKAEGAKYDWEIFQELAHLLNGKTGTCTPEAPEVKLDMGLKHGAYQLSVQQLIDNPHGIDLGELKPVLPQRLFTPNKRVDLAPTIFINDIERVKKAMTQAAPSQEFPFLLIGRRHLRDNNSWLHNSQRLIKGRNRCTLMMHPADATILNLDNEQVIKITSRVGTVELPIEITENMMRGVVSMPHGYGHGRPGVQLNIAQQHAGVSVNDLTDELVLDELTGNAAFSNVAVRVYA
jgi:anaerobic selenocysteine-containing dehydrogenase